MTGGAGEGKMRARQVASKIAFTSIATNYLPKARVLAASLKRHNPEFKFYAIIADEFDRDMALEGGYFDGVLSLEDLKINNLKQWVFSHTIVELCTAVKGRTLRKLLDMVGGEDGQVYYFDPDMVVTGALTDLVGELAGSSVVLTPHGIEPEADDAIQAIIDNEISHLNYGVYNLGFVGVRNTASGRAFADWWASRLDRFCTSEIERGLFTDQRWVDLAPCLFDGVNILRSPRYNVATWNLSHRVVTGNLETGLLVNEEPLGFYHFSGFDSGAQEVMLERYGKRSPILNVFRDWYIAEAERLGQSTLGVIPWAFGRFGNGNKITPQQRTLYRNRADLRAAFPDPFAVEPGLSSYWDWYRVHGGDHEAKPESSPSHRILAVVAGDDANRSAAWLGQIMRHSDRSGRIEVIVPEPLAAYLPSGNGAKILPCAGPDDFERALIAEIAGSAMDCAVVFSNIEVPPLWNLRLAIHAKQHASIATASPLSTVDPLVKVPVCADDTVVKADQAIFLRGIHHAVDAPALFGRCFYAIAGGVSASQGVSGVSRAASLMGRAHVIACDILVMEHEGEWLGKAFRATSAFTAEFTKRQVLGEIRQFAEERARAVSCDSEGSLPTVLQFATKRILHVSHSWGGGLENWVQSYCAADSHSLNFVLKSHGGHEAAGQEVTLNLGTQCLEHFALPVPIRSTSQTNLSYRKNLKLIVETYGIDAIIVSSLVGHSFDLFDCGVPAYFVCHDYFPLHPEVYVRSRHISGGRLAGFSVTDALDVDEARIFWGQTAAEAEANHAAFRRLIADRRVKLVAPSVATRQLYLDLAPELRPKDIAVIPHGTREAILSAERPNYDPDGKLRVVVVGRVAPEKGSRLFAEIAPKITAFAKVYLLGCGADGLRYADTPGIEAIVQYEPSQLPAMLREINPHAALLLSDFAETYSYVLDEMQALGVPPVGVRQGAYLDRIADGLTGFLCNRSSDGVVDCLRRLDGDRDALRTVAENLRASTPRTETVMVRDYERLMGLPRFSAKALTRPNSLTAACFAGVSPDIDDVIPLVGCAVPRVDALNLDYCAVIGSDFTLHPAEKGARVTTALFSEIEVGSVTRVSAVAELRHVAQPVLVRAMLVDLSDRQNQCVAVVNVTHDTPRTISVELPRPAERVAVIFQSEMADEGAGNNHAWLAIAKPRLHLAPHSRAH